MISTLDPETIEVLLREDRDKWIEAMETDKGTQGQHLSSRETTSRKIDCGRQVGLSSETES